MKIEFNNRATVGYRILVVDDDKVNRLFLQKLLEQLGYETDLVENGVEAVEAVKATLYDLVLMDCQMPVMDGYEASRLIKSILPVHQQPPIVAITANAMPADRERCLNAGMDDYMAKPIKVFEFSNMIEKWLPTLPVRAEKGAVS